MMMTMKLLLLVNNVIDDGILVSLLTKLTHGPAKILNVNSACVYKEIPLPEAGQGLV
jgi:hypothetical protein